MAAAETEAFFPTPAYFSFAVSSARYLSVVIRNISMFKESRVELLMTSPKTLTALLKASYWIGCSLPLLKVLLILGSMLEKTFHRVFPLQGTKIIKYTICLFFNVLSINLVFLSQLPFSVKQVLASHNTVLQQFQQATKELIFLLIFFCQSALGLKPNITLESMLQFTPNPQNYNLSGTLHFVHSSNS